ncbi:hypothetical protein E2C01_020017 [Portunus trituberculatus]|uniref:Uncharacterized protein n=1 Tax=Portunus trituberculatus TaxID=210409 RepID=A0A5B7E0Z4_PORTR|nr:hypothetical protein [Portunus trituberculatus]
MNSFRSEVRADLENHIHYLASLPDSHHHPLTRLHSQLSSHLPSIAITLSAITKHPRPSSHPVNPAQPVTPHHRPSPST